MNSQQNQSQGKSESGTPNRASQSSNQPSNQEQSQTSPSLSGAIRSQGQSQGAESQSKRENLGTEQISGLNGLDTSSQARGLADTIGNHNRQTGAGGKAQAAAGTAQPQAGQSGQSSRTADRGAQKSSEAPAWQKTLKSGWQNVSGRVLSASPAELAIGAAAIGAALWLGTRKRSSSANSNQQSAADRWGQAEQSRFSQASNVSGEPWQRPTSERWDD